jgi:hypothetical protein
LAVAGVAGSAAVRMPLLRQLSNPEPGLEELISDAVKPSETAEDLARAKDPTSGSRLFVV